MSQQQYREARRLTPIRVATVVTYLFCAVVVYLDLFVFRPF